MLCKTDIFSILFIDVDYRDEEDLTPLHYAARYKRERTRKAEAQLDVSRTYNSIIKIGLHI